MTEIKFKYPSEGYVFYLDEEQVITVLLTGKSGKNANISASVVDFYGNEEFVNDRQIVFGDCGEAQIDYSLGLTRLGYHKLSIKALSEDGAAEKSTGIGVTSMHERSGFESAFGVSCNFWNPQQDIPMYKRIGVRFVRNPGKDTTIKNQRVLRENGMYSTVQLQGNDMFAPGRYAHYKRNTAYYYQKQYGDLSAIIEHGNEHWEERDLGLLAEWVKSSGLARLEADPSAWHSGSGLAGVDIEKMQVLFEQGMYDYTTFIAVHAYSFPGMPESPASYWSTKRLEDLAAFMDKNGIDMPVCCTEQGYPAMYDQSRSESYSPGDMVSITAQVDYLVRSWLIFLSYGVAKIVWFNGPWYDGFGIQEKDGPAPWPAMMGLAQLIREVDGAEYIGDYTEDEGIEFKVFRQRDGGLTASIWKPIYYSRSCEKEKNLSLDLSGTEADGTVRESYEYLVKYIDPKSFEARDIMGNRIESDGLIMVGESPVYVSGISEDIVSRLKDKTIFKTKKVTPRPLPERIILGIGDEKPYYDAFITSRFMPGEKRRYKLRVHNFSDNDLEDTLIISADEAFQIKNKRIKVSVLSGQSVEIPVEISCRKIAQIGTYDISVTLEGTRAHRAFVRAGIYSPLYFVPLISPIKSGTQLQLNFTNNSDEKTDYVLTAYSKDMQFRDSEISFTCAKGQSIGIPLEISRCERVVEPVVDITLKSGGSKAYYQTVIPLHYIEFSNENGKPVEDKKQQMIISGYDLMMTSGEKYTGPDLFGMAKPEPLTAYARFELDEKVLKARFEILDDIVVCMKNSRRNNIDSDGIWIKLFHSAEDEKPYRHFSVVPADQAGRAEGCYVNEVSANVLFAYPFSNFDRDKIHISSRILDDSYIVNVEIDRGSIDLWKLRSEKDEIVMNLRVINMNHNDWPRFYDTGKIAFKIVR